MAKLPWRFGLAFVSESALSTALERKDLRAKITPVAHLHLTLQHCNISFVQVRNLLVSPLRIFVVNANYAILAMPGIAFGATNTSNSEVVSCWTWSNQHSEFRSSDDYYCIE